MFGRELTQAEVEAMQSSKPMVTLVDRKGHIRGYADEDEIHVRGNRKPHRAMQIFVWSPDKQEIIIKLNRSGECKNMWGAIGTHVYYAEDYIAAAVRELNTKLGLGLSMRAAQGRLRFVFQQDACLGTKMEHIRFYTFVLNSGEVVKSKEPLMSLPFDDIKHSVHEINLVTAPVFRLLISRFIRNFTGGPAWRNIL